MKLLLHTCCAPCSVYCIKSLREEGIEPTLFWYNPNIHPYSEYKARRDCLVEYAKTKKEGKRPLLSTERLCPLQNSYAEALTSSVAIFGDGAH